MMPTQNHLERIRMLASGMLRYSSEFLECEPDTNIGLSIGMTALLLAYQSLAAHLADPEVAIEQGVQFLDGKAGREELARKKAIFDEQKKRNQTT